MLPITLLDFSAVLYKDCDSVKLYWSTAFELNNGSFRIERSSDFLNWSTVAVINSIGNSTVITSYDIVDRQPVIGRVYYRLIQTDINGQENVLETVVLTCRKNIIVELIGPNPTDGTLRGIIYTATDGITTIQIIDVLGRLVFERRYHVKGGWGPNFLNWDFKFLSSGSNILLGHFLNDVDSHKFQMQYAQQN